MSEISVEVRQWRAVEDAVLAMTHPGLAQVRAQLRAVLSTNYEELAPDED